MLQSAPTRRAEQMRAAEALHDDIDADTTYPFDFLAFRLTGFRRDHGTDVMLVGAAVRPDLRRVIDLLSGSLSLPLSDGDAMTTDQLAARLGVSTKTLSRWRKEGLRWRKVEPLPGARKVIAFTEEAVRRFREDHGERVERAAAFTQIEPADRARLIERARRLAGATDASFNRVATHLAGRTGRAVETVRLILEKHDRDRPNDPLFPDRTGPLTPRQKRLISRAYRRGIGVGKLSERFRRSRATIHRVVLERRAARALRLPLSHIDHPNFRRDEAEQVYLAPRLEPRHPDPRQTTVPLDGLPSPLRELYVQPVVSPDKVRSLFLRFNYLKFRAAATRERFNRGPARAADVASFEADIARAARVRSLLTTWHLPVVLSVARRHLVGENPSPGRLIELLERGNPTLIESVDAYDARGRPSFEAFLTNRLLRTFAAQPAGPTKARKREGAEAVVQRMINLAGESGVRLALGTEEAAEGDEPQMDADRRG